MRWEQKEGGDLLQVVCYRVEDKTRELDMVE